jgi:2-dehydro-3-deoxyphosphogluconate aldolase/(4S)-4-hydroxy-2-oxoglutarate aldolase
MTRVPVEAPGAPRPVGPYSQGARVGRLLSTAGQGAQDPETGQLAVGDIAAQTRQCLRNVEAILRAGGATLDDVIRVSVFLARKADYDGMNAVYREFFPTDPPARTTVYTGLAPDELLVEIDALAVLPDAVGGAPPADIGADALARIAAARVVPVLRADDADDAARLAERLIDAGLRVIELTTTIPSWATLLDRLRSAHPDVCIGMGTITDPDTADAVARAGAAFGVTPYPVPGARARLAAYDLPLLEGGATPGEVLGAARAGVAKLFPAHIGGPEYLRSLLAVAPDARIMPTGGVALDDVPAWLRAGAYAVGVGSDLAQDDVAARLSRVLGGVGE